jgi:hypothetical protein
VLWAVAGFPDGGERHIEKAIRGTVFKVFKIGFRAS